MVWAVSKTVKGACQPRLLTALTVLTTKNNHSSHGLKIWKLVPNWANKEQFLSMKLDGYSLQALCCLTQTQTNRNTLCTLIHGSISGTLSCQNHTSNIPEITKLVKHLFQCL